MSAQVVAFRDPRAEDERQALLAAVDPLHSLITLDPILGASPVRVYFVVSPQNRDRVAACLDPADRSRFARAFALVTFDFPYALQLLAAASPRAGRGSARAIAACSAGLQGAALQAAAAAFGIDAQPIPAFDAGALKAGVFPNTQETVTHLFRLACRSGPNTPSTRPPGAASHVRDA
jgi:nitroreductase